MGRRRHHKDEWEYVVTALGWLIMATFIVAAWLIWAALVLPTAAVVALRSRATAGRMVRSLIWSKKWHQANRSARQDREFYAPEAVAARAVAKADHDSRTYRAVVAECHLDGIHGGSFLIRADGREDVRLDVRPDDALLFLSLKNGDIVQVTMAPGDGEPRLDEFWHLSRANGARPRNPADFGPGMVPVRG